MEISTEKMTKEVPCRDPASLLWVFGVSKAVSRLRRGIKSSDFVTPLNKDMNAQVTSGWGCVGPSDKSQH